MRSQSDQNANAENGPPHGWSPSPGYPSVPQQIFQQGVQGFISPKVSASGPGGT